MAGDARDRQHGVHAGGHLHGRQVGRKPLLLAGIVGVGDDLLAGGWFYLIVAAPALLFCVFAFFLACFAFSYGAVVWIIVAEIFPTAIRGRAMSISIFSLWTGCTASSARPSLAC